METITGQKAVATKAKNSVANFKIREGMAIGCKTTLRGEKMYEFMDRLINLALPRVRDFRGVNPNAFDGRGNSNDIVLNQKKICGILTEMSTEIDYINYVVTGVGINTNQPGFPEELEKTATSLLIEQKGRRY